MKPDFWRWGNVRWAVVGCLLSGAALSVVPARAVADVALLDLSDYPIVRTRLSEPAASPAPGKQPRTISQRITAAVADRLKGITSSGALEVRDVAAAALQAGLTELSANWIHHLDMRYRPGYGNRDDTFDADVLVALLQRERGAMQVQAGAHLQAGETGFHTGLSYHHLLTEQLLLGTNLFYDFLSAPNVSRWSVGMELRNLWLDLHANWYHSLQADTSGRLPNGTGSIEYYSMNGFDAQLVGHVPILPWLEVAGRLYRWEHRLAADISGQEYSMVLRPVPLFNAEVFYDNPENSDSAWGVQLGLSYRLGVPLIEQLQPDTVQPATPSLHNLNRARRQYEQRIWRRDVLPGFVIGGVGPARQNSLQATTIEERFEVPIRATNLPTTTLPADTVVAAHFSGDAVYGTDYQVVNTEGTADVLTATLSDGQLQPITVSSNGAFNIPYPDTRSLRFNLQISAQDSASEECATTNCNVILQIRNAQRELLILAPPDSTPAP